MKTLHPVLSFHWYDATVDGDKRIEYRSMTNPSGFRSKWRNQIWDKREEITHVRFSRGYTSTTCTYEVVKIDIGDCPIDGWDDQYYRVHFKEVEQ